MGSTRYAVLVGNGSFTETNQATPRLPELRCPAADVAGLRDLLIQPTHGAYAVTTLVDKSHNEIQRALYDCLKKARPEDQVLIYYSGHGKLDQQGNLYLAGSDTDPEALAPTALAAAEVQSYVDESRAGARIVILDCCFSGAVDRIFRQGTAKGEVAEQVGQALRSRAGQGVFYLTASTDVQTAEEKDQDEYSLLTKHIISGIKGDADMNDDGEVRFSELCDFVQTSVQKEGAQRPLSFALKAYGDPVIAFTGRPALAARREAIEQQVYTLRSKKLLDGADAARVLNYIHGAGAAPSVMQALHDACEDDGAFLRILHRLSDNPAQADQTRDASSPAKTSIEDRQVSPPPVLPARWPLGPRALLVSIVIITIMAGGVVWLSRPTTQEQTPYAGSGSPTGAPSLVRPSGPLIKGSTRLVQ
jgi:uncharacterized caspase-like protein